MGAFSLIVVINLLNRFSVIMKRASAFNEGFSFDPNDVTIPEKSSKKKKKKPNENNNEDAERDAVSESLSTIDLLIKNVMREKSDFYSRISRHTSEQAKKGDVVKQKSTSVKQKTMKRDSNLEDFTAIPAVRDEEAPDFLRFDEMHLSRPLLKGISAMGYDVPTPIQQSCIPIGLQGKDICACSSTGTGKTAAFMLPILERLLFKPANGVAVTRVLILLPTRELAVQVFQVSKSLAKFSKIQITLAAGGLDLKTQEDAVRRFPDILVATPGRLIDILVNTPSFHLQNIEILVLDEADRILDESFEDQIKEIVKGCSRNRQTMLFSATMSDQVRDLAVVSLKNPVKIFVDSSLGVAQNLRQEFIRVRAPMEQYRESMLVSLLVRNFTNPIIVFVPTKQMARRMHILLGLFGLSVGELHGNIPQTIRLDTLNRFKDGKFEVLIATDVAARGLDIKGVTTVINYAMPKNYKQYIHRVGRTARAGKSGVSVTLYGEKDRKIMKDVMKYSRSTLKNRSIPPDVIEFYKGVLDAIEVDIQSINSHEDTNADIYKLEARIKKAEATLTQHEDLYGKQGTSKSSDRT